jgi:hypothetical protein
MIKVRIDRIDVKGNGSFSVFVGDNEFPYNSIEDAIRSSGDVRELLRRLILLNAVLSCPNMTVDDLPGFVGNFVELSTDPTPDTVRLAFGKDEI